MFRALRRRGPAALGVGLAAVLVAATACGGDDGSASASAGGKVALTVNVFGNFGYEQLYKQFEATHPLAAKYDGGLAVHARPLRIHGAWPGIGDDVPKQRDVEHDGPVLVLTLAKTKFSRFVPFFRASQPAEKAVATAPGNVFSSAVLRPPFISSVSLWESSEAAMDYAFTGHQMGHPEAIAAGRAKPFHHEQAFIRLAINEIRGSLAGRNTLPPGSVRV